MIHLSMTVYDLEICQRITNLGSDLRRDTCNRGTDIILIPDQNDIWKG